MIKIIIWILLFKESNVYGLLKSRTLSINRFSETFEHDRIQLKDEEAEIEMTGNRK